MTKRDKAWESWAPPPERTRIDSKTNSPSEAKEAHHKLRMARLNRLGDELRKLWGGDGTCPCCGVDRLAEWR